MSTYITSPTGTIQFLALNRKVAKDMNAGSSEGYAIRLKFDGATAEGAEFKAAIAKINPNLIGTKHTDTKSEYTVRAFTLFAPEVMDGNGNTMEELPNFYKDSVGTAVMVVQPYLGNSLGGTINLAGVVIHSIETTESETGGSSSDLLAQLRETLKNAAKQS